MHILENRKHLHMWATASRFSKTIQHNVYFYLSSRSYKTLLSSKLDVTFGDIASKRMVIGCNGWLRFQGFNIVKYINFFINFSMNQKQA